jgi:hypothetical protein
VDRGMSIETIEAFRDSVCIPLAEGVKVEPEYWLDDDTGESYCMSCALLVIEECNMIEGKTLEIDGGWGMGEHDTCCHCTKCGVILEYTLTDYGVDAEIDHFLSGRDDGPLTPSDAFHLLKVFDGVVWPPEETMAANLDTIVELYGAAA